MVIVDSSVWIDHIGGVPNEHTVWLEQQIGKLTLGITDLIYMEVLQGFSNERVFRRVRGELVRWCLPFNTGGLDMALAAAVNYRTLRALGFTVRKPVDTLIATLCLREKCSLLHRDREFDAFEKHLELKVVHPTRH